MSRAFNHRGIVIAAVLCLMAATPASAKNAGAPLDSTLFAGYNITPALDSISWIVCGSTKNSSGCYGFGSMGPFKRVGAVIEGNPGTRGNTVTRDVYVVDLGAQGKTVSLYVYKKQDIITDDFDTVTVTLIKTVTLPLIGGPDAKASMAANKGYLFIGTDQSPQAVRVTKKNLAVVPVGGFSPPINVVSITSNKYGFVTVTQGSFSGGESGFYVFGPDGGVWEDGGGTQFMLGTQNAVLPPELVQ